MKDLLARRAHLDAEIAAHRATHRIDIVKQIAKLMQEYGISLRDLEPLLPGKGATPQQRARVLIPRYRDPDTGATWAGRGKLPRWMKGRDPEKLKINAEELELILQSRDASTPIQRPVEPLFRDPETGETWSGRGRRPAWMKGRNTEELRIKPLVAGQQEKLDP
ncbi:MULTISPECIES: H-NS family nucleoid-associated regulatory protein [unclassified Burkholderia]|uniref:H-NS family nucleoid-associated regulatory protein n=1 Tax=unclassified Burkholderia TaxID=2613784 RepID=UPI00162761FE|nr:MULTISPECIES: H-NS family nucleoid-associated regulatory protein [unclassified Burkholderia]